LSESKTNPHLQDNLLHFLIRRLELSNEDQHDFSGVIVGVLSVHQGDEVTNGLQEGSKTLQHTHTQGHNTTMDFTVKKKRVKKQT
jgi:hypothetical protein